MAFLHSCTMFYAVMCFSTERSKIGRRKKTAGDTDERTDEEGRRREEEDGR